MHILSLFAKAAAFVAIHYGKDFGPFRLWMRDVDGKMARVVGLPQSDVVRYNLDGGDKAFECSLAEWERLPIWTGNSRSDR